jgi:hypothetical protein
MARPNLNLLDKGALGFALARIDTNAFEDEWAIFGGKFFIAISLAFHFIMLLGIVLNYDLPSRPIITVIGFAVAAVIYVPIRLLTHSASEIQQAKLSRREKWLYRAWAVFILPGSMLLWMPLL